ncbi:MAG: YlxR family protein [Candidatus Dormibacteraeota bacterium]|nr:YlxR family protein [Candidatus Dormibacteraeota bacterium]
MRTCVACRLEAGRNALTRFVRAGDGSITEDPSGRAPGRGAYLHDDSRCRDLAVRRHSLERALKVRANRER